MEHDPAPSAARARQCRADYRWTMPKAIAFLDALAQCGNVAAAARAVGMSRQSAYRLRARLAGGRFGAGFELAREAGLEARIAARRVRSRWEGPGLAEIERMATRRGAQGDGSHPLGDTSPPQGDTSPSQGDTSPSQGDTGRAKATLSPTR